MKHSQATRIDPIGRMLSLLMLSTITLGTAIHWHISNVGVFLPWTVAAVALVAMIVLGKGDWLHRHMENALAGPPWPWLIAAILINAVVLFIGHTEYGVTRWYGNEHFALRASFWAMLPLLVFLTIFSRLESPGLVPQIASMAGLGMFTLASYMQPDWFSLVVLFALAIYFGLLAKNHMRIWLPLTAISGLGIGFLYVVSATYRWERLTSFLHSSSTDPQGQGFVLHQTQSAFEQAGLWGSDQSHLLNNATQMMELEWSLLPQLSLWLGNVLMFTVLFLLVVFLVILALRALYHADHNIKPLLMGSLILLVVSQVFAVAPSFGLLPHTGHYGIIGLHSGGTTLLALFALALSWKSSQSV